MLLVGVMVLLGCVTPFASAESDDDDESDKMDPHKYLGITRCSACEDLVGRIVASARTTPLGQKVTSMHRKDEALTLKRTKLARAHELVEAGCVAEKRGSPFISACQDALGELDEKLVKFVVSRLDPPQSHEDKAAVAARFESAQEEGKESLCVKFCGFKADMKNQVDQAKKKLEAHAMESARKKFGGLTPEAVWKVLKEYWYMYVALAILTMAGTMWFISRVGGAGSGRVLGTGSSAGSATPKKDQ
jgi:hypothetical protein